MNWIKISEIDNHNLSGKSIIVWQNNLSDPNSSRFQKGIFYNGTPKRGNFIKIYHSPLTIIYVESEDWINYDLEGDSCQLTHFMIVESPKN